MTTPQKQLTGAEALIKCLENYGVEYIWGLSGGAAIPIFDALVGSKIKLVLVRHEQGATHIADGYARVTGKPGVVLVTSGPGATNTITGIMTAHMDSVPMIVLTGQTISPMLGKDAFQEADIFGSTMPFVKHSYLVRNTNDIPRIIKEAFHIANTGRPGPVLVDLPKDITSGPFTGKTLDPAMDIPGYKVAGKGNLSDIKKMAKLFKNSKRPLLLIGHGAVIARAGDAIKKLAYKLQSPVTNTLLGKGEFPETDPLSLGMLGMHGTAYANLALTRCDLILSIGSRWDDRINGNPAKFCVGAKILHIDIDPAEIGKILKPDVHCIGDARLIVEELLKHVSPCDTKEWIAELNGYKKKHPLKFDTSKGLTAQYVLYELQNAIQGNAIVTTDVGQHQMWSAQFNLSKDGRKWLSSGGAGTMGYGFPAAIGAQFGAPKDLVIAVVGDGGFQMTFYELATVYNHKLPVKVLIIDNKYLGMVRQWQELFFDNRLSGVDLEGNPDFVKLADAYRIKGVHIDKVEHVAERLKEAIDFPGPVVIWAEVIKEDNVFPMVPAGKSAYEMIIEPPKAKLEKPTGST
ncbi:MAG: acetolactate synthase, large subunit, biosynthetic type [Omnitrophica WOR_2 bacterium GWA2_47_8]|nr:MAG: acetolactate synthase, large subunit, biosynthetic type [Omnitrophica WOR_2 bacterium GWA2_47_8]